MDGAKIQRLGAYNVQTTRRREIKGKRNIVIYVYVYKSMLALHVQESPSK